MCVLLVLSGASRAADDSVWTLYAQGRYSEAQSAGEARGDASGYALAARANLAVAAMREHGCLECLKAAEADARRAIALDPKPADAHVFLAAALGYEGRFEGLVAARMHDYPGQAKHELDTALAGEPGNCWALAALGGWNIEVVRGGGATLARWLYGARLDDGMHYFSRAFACAPDNLVFRYQFALSLSGLDFDTYRASITDSLTKAVALTPVTAYDKFAQGRARELLDAIKTKGTGAVMALVRRDQGYP